MSSQTDAGEIASAFDGRDLAERAVTEVAHIELRPRNIGARIKRVEDRRLLTGQGMFTDDRAVAGAPHVAALFDRVKNDPQRSSGCLAERARCRRGASGSFVPDAAVGTKRR